MRALWNENWKFALLPLESSYADMQRTEKRQVILPHDWLIENTDALYQNGDGWYVKTLVRETEETRQRVFLDFDGVYMDADVLLNGQVIRTHHYGYTAFRVELSDLRPGENEIAVHVRHQSPNSRWYSGAGIFRDVYLLTLPARCLLPDGFQINTRLENGGWIVDVDAELDGPADGIAPRAELRDAAGSIAAVGEMTLDGNAAHISFTLKNGCPWSLEAPYLYSLSVSLNGQEETLAVGLRETAFTPDRGFFLNGKHIKLHGVCLHHDLGALGAAFHAPAMERQLRLMQRMGVNAIRTSHNPPARQLLDLCDRLGLLVMDEAYDMWELPKTTYDNARFFPQTWPQTVAEWVRRDRCHPSVILWSIGNEIYDMQASDRGQMWTKLLSDEVKKHDSRHAAVTFGSNYMPWEGAQKCADIIKLPGYNYAEKYYAEHHAQHPDWVIFGSETASLLASRGVYHFPMGADIMSDEDLQCSALLNSNTSWGARDLRAMLADDLNTEYSLGQFVWSGIDYIGEPTPYHTRNCYFGQADTACFPKDSFYFYQAMWTDAPMVHIGVSWDWNAGQLIDVPVMTNGAAAELFLNGASLGLKPVNRLDAAACLPVWQVPFQPGALRACAYDAAGNLLCEAERHTPGEAAALCLTADLQVLRGSVGDMAFLTVTAVDAAGLPVENAVNRVHVEIAGPAVLLGLDNGDSTDRDGYQVFSRRLFSGRLLIMLGAQAGPGTVRVRVTSPGLTAAETALTVQPAAGEKRSFPELCRENETETDIWIRRIDLQAQSDTRLTPAHPSVTFRLRALPESAADQPIACRITNAEGIEMPCAALTRQDGLVTVTALGDGKMYLRATAANGYPHARVISLVEITAEGFGPMGIDPYRFVSGSLSDIRIGEIGAGNEQGIAFARDGKSAAGFRNVDFGPEGSDTLTIPVFALNGDRYDIVLWDGIPGQDGKKICDLTYQKPSIWNTYQPETYRLPYALTGVHTLCFSLDCKIHLKGFTFARQSRAFRDNRALDADQIYGDSFLRGEDAVREIGNNVTLSFGHMRFEQDGPVRLRIEGATPLDVNTVSVRITDENGDARTSVCDFRRAPERAAQDFTVEAPAGLCTVAFVFLPGSQFDFYGFRFMEEA